MAWTVSLKKLKKIYETPVETIDGDNITYMFVAPSEDFVKKIANIMLHHNLLIYQLMVVHMVFV